MCPLIKSVGLDYWIQKIHLQPDAVKLIFTLLSPCCFLYIHLIFLNFSSLPCFSLLLTLYLSLTSFISYSLSRSLDQNGGSRGGRDNSQSSRLLPGGKCDTALHCISHHKTCCPFVSLDPSIFITLILIFTITVDKFYLLCKSSL